MIAGIYPGQMYPGGSPTYATVPGSVPIIHEAALTFTTVTASAASHTNLQTDSLEFSDG